MWCSNTRPNCFPLRSSSTAAVSCSRSGPLEMRLRRSSTLAMIVVRGQRRNASRITQARSMCARARFGTYSEQQHARNDLVSTSWRHERAGATRDTDHALATGDGRCAPMPSEFPTIRIPLLVVAGRWRFPLAARAKAAPLHDPERRQAPPFGGMGGGRALQIGATTAANSLQLTCEPEMVSGTQIVQNLPAPGLSVPYRYLATAPRSAVAPAL